jgi:hypothetical protein
MHRKPRVAARFLNILLGLVFTSFAVQQVAAEEASSLAKYDAYVGDYQLGPYMVVSVTHEGNQMFAQAGDQPFMELAPETDTKFVVKNLSGIGISFVKDATGAVTGAIIHQGLNNTPAPRIASTQAQEIRDALAKRVDEQIPFPGSEAALVRHLEGIRSGKPIYDQMTPDLAAAVRGAAAQGQALLAQLGAVQSITFKSVIANGADMFEVIYENGATQYGIGLAPDGKINTLNYRRVDKPAADKPAASGQK